MLLQCHLPSPSFIRFPSGRFRPTALAFAFPRLAFSKLSRPSLADIPGSDFLSLQILHTLGSRTASAAPESCLPVVCARLSPSPGGSGRVLLHPNFHFFLLRPTFNRHLPKRKRCSSRINITIKYPTDEKYAPFFTMSVRFQFISFEYTIIFLSHD